jgi:hypothetical protein
VQAIYEIVPAQASSNVEVKYAMNLYPDIEKHGGHAIMWKTGHSLIKAKLKEEKPF